MSNYDVVVKAVDPAWVLAVTEALASVADIGQAHERSWPRLHERLEELGVERVPPSIAREHGRDPIRFTAAIPVPETLSHQADGFATAELPALPRVAATVVHGDPDFHGAFQALHVWAREANETEAGEIREVYLDCDGPRDTSVVELQVALTPKT